VGFKGSQVCSFHCVIWVIRLFIISVLSSSSPGENVLLHSYGLCTWHFTLATCNIATDASLVLLIHCVAVKSTFVRNMELYIELNDGMTNIVLYVATFESLNKYVNCLSEINICNKLLIFCVSHYSLFVLKVPLNTNQTQCYMSVPSSITNMDNGNRRVFVSFCHESYSEVILLWQSIHYGVEI